MPYASRGLESAVEFSTSLELSRLLGGDVDLLLCQRVDALTSSACGNRECAETNESNLVALLEFFSYRCNECINSLLGVYLAESCLCSNSSYEFAFVHKIRNFKVNIKKTWFLTVYSPIF